MQSLTDLANGPAVAVKWPLGISKLQSLAEFPPLYVNLYWVGLNPTIPLNAAGILILPPISVPIPSGTHLAATRPASPPLLPPHDLSWLYGFCALPQILLSEWIERAACGRLPLTRGIAPPYKSLIRIALSSWTLLFLIAQPTVTNIPCISMSSLTEIGIPWKNGNDDWVPF